MEAQILELERQIEEMGLRHAQEIQLLKEQVEALRQTGSEPAVPASEEDEATRLRKLAMAQAAREEPAQDIQETAFEARGLSLQALNPEISVTGDMLAFARQQDASDNRSGFKFRNLGIHIESYLDPYTRLKAAVPVSTNGAELGEAYMTRYGVFGGTNLTLGKFRQQFGVVNRWHKHALDQVDFPLALRQIFGEGGLNQTGASLESVLPELWSSSQELTNGENPRLFSGNTLGTPSILAHFKSFRELSKDTYLELGLSSLVGWRNEWQVAGGDGPVTVRDSLPTWVFGLDLNLLWEPTGRMRYRNLEWRSELYYLDRDIQAPDGSGQDTINSWGGFTSLQTKISRTVDVGVRLDYYDADQKAYAAVTPWLAPHAFATDVRQWQYRPYVTWWQSPFVKYRIQYTHLEPGDIAEPEDILIFQVIFAAGPHKHERY